MGPTLVVVDTEDQHLGHVRQALSAEGYSLLEAGDKGAMLAALESADCQLVLVNLAVPNLEALCEGLRNSPLGALVPMIFMGCGDPQAHRIRSPAEALGAGGDYYFAAPFDMRRVIAKVRTYSGLGRQEDGAGVELGDLDKPSRARPHAAQPEPLAGASDALLAQICDREAEMAQMLRDGPAPSQQLPGMTPGRRTAAVLSTGDAAQDDQAHASAAARALGAPTTAPAAEAAARAPKGRGPEAPERAVSITYRPLAPASGTLKQDYDLARLFCDASRQRVTGRIILENGHAQSVVYFIDGAPTKVQSLRSDHRLEEYLLRSKKITVAQYQAVRLRGLRRSPQVKAFLLEKNMLGADVLEEALHTQLKECLIDLFGYTTANFSYSPQLCEVSCRLHLRVDLRNVVMQAIRKHYVLEQLIRRVGSADTYVAVRPEQQAQLDALTLTGAELALLSLLDGRRSLGEVATLSGLKMERVYQAVYGMLCVEAARVARQAELGEDDAAIAAEQAASGRIMEKVHQVRMQDYFQVLEVGPDIGMQELEAAFLSVTQKFSPAAFAPGVQSEQGQNLAEIRIVLQEAYDVLRDPQLRPLYGRHVA